MNDASSEQAFEVNFDGLVGLSHNFAGLSVGNVASESHAGETSQPKKAALQGLKKMRTLYDLGLKQGFIPPQERPQLSTLRMLGFSGSDEQILQKVGRQHPHLLHAVCSASSMWTANACTVSPSADTENGKVHFTVANLANKFHRSIEAPTTEALLRAIFPDEQYFQIHAALPSVNHFGDEGAANHSRLCREYGDAGIEMFVYGKSVFHTSRKRPKVFPARQTLESCEAIARCHGLQSDATLFFQQHPSAIDAGVFHNDVIAVANKNVLFYHEYAFLDEALVLEKLQANLGADFTPIRVSQNDVPMKAAVKSYLFNSQLISLKDGSMALIAPWQSKKSKTVSAYLEKLVADKNPISDIIFLKLNQSMKNGGGPACLRQRVVLTESELKAVNQSCLFTPEKQTLLESWINKHYRDKLELEDLMDPKFLQETREALDELTQLLNLGSIYPFQKQRSDIIL